jgi:ABC-type glycerol-3-phosphate transport system substrate-binding protein
MAVPTSLAAVGVLYNKGVLARLHLRVPSSTAAFERALRNAKAAGYTPIGMGNADGWLGDDWYLTLVNALASPQQLAPEFSLSRQFSFRQQPFVQAAATLQRWSRRGYFTQDFGGLDAQEGIDQFFHGRTLFQLISSSENSQIQQDQQQTGLPIGVFAFPDVRGSASSTQWLFGLGGAHGGPVPTAGNRLYRQLTDAHHDAAAGAARRPAVSYPRDGAECGRRVAAGVFPRAGHRATGRLPGRGPGGEFERDHGGECAIAAPGL